MTLEEKLKKAKPRGGLYRDGVLASVFEGKLPLNPPPGLGKEGCRLWRQVVECIPDYLVRQVDAAGLYSLCKMWCSYLKAARAFDKAVVGSLEYHKLCKTTCELFSKFHAAANSFGMSPSARAKFRNPPPKEKNDENPLERMKLVRARPTG